MGRSGREDAGKEAERRGSADEIRVRRGTVERETGGWSGDNGFVELE